jgi:hypothetical protein
MGDEQAAGWRGRHPNKQRKTAMLRNIAFAVATAAALGTAALAPTAASAHGFGPGGHFVGGPHFGPHFGPGYYGPHRWGRGWGWGVGIGAGLVGSAIVADSCVRREVFYTPYGPRYRWVNVCY